jgi:hypothetical protein
LRWLRSNCCCPAWAACILPCQISLSFLMRSCVPALAIVGQPSRYPVAVPPELTGFRLRVLCICESSTAYSSPNNT